MRRILVWFWSRGGGGSQFAANLAHRLTLEFGRAHVALSLAADDPTTESAAARGVEVRIANVVAGRDAPLRTALGLSRAAETLHRHVADRDIVVAAMNFAALAPLSAMLRKPLVYCVHDPRPHPGDYAALAQRVTQAALWRRADAVAALSRFAASQTPRCAVRKLRIAPLSSVFEPREPPPRAPGPVRLLFAGRMIRYKGAERLAEALERIAGRDDWRLSVAGAGPAATPALARRFDFPQTEAIELRTLAELEMQARFAGCDVLLAPYESATQSGVVADALAWGKPCVATPVGALPEQIDEGAAGWIAEDLSSAAYAAALARALDNAQDRVRRAEGAHRRARRCWESDCWNWLQAGDL